MSLLKASSVSLLVAFTTLGALAACGDDAPEPPAPPPGPADAAPVDGTPIPPADADIDAAAVDAGPADADTTPDAEPADADTTPDADPLAPTRAILKFDGPAIDFFANDMTGFRFTVGADDVTLTDLGFWDSGEDGLGEAHPVGIFEVATQSLVVSATVPAGTASPLESGFRYAPIAPTTLHAGTTYVAVAWRPTAVDGVAYLVQNLKVSPLVHYDTEVAANHADGLVFCNTPWGDPNSWFGPNFKMHR